MKQMKHNRLTRAAAWLSLALLLVSQLSLPALAAGQTVSFRMDTVAGNKGDIVTVPVYLNSAGGGSVSFGGLSLALTFDNTRLAYIEGSGRMLQSAMSDATVNLSVTSPKINIVWFSNSVISVTSGSQLCSLQFRILDEAANGQAALSLAIPSIYTFTIDSNHQVQWEDLVVTSPVAGYVNVSSEGDSAVNAVIAAINAIGTVTYSDACLAKITNAAGKYALLTVSQRANVTNYQTLLDAKAEYERLKAASSSDPVDQEISAFLTAHAQALALTIDNVTLGDEARVAAAYSAFNALSINAKYEVFQYNASLKALTARINILKKEDEDRKAAEEEERRLRAEADQLASDFRKNQKTLLSMSVNDVVSDHYTALSSAVATLNVICEVNPYVESKLAAERIVLEALLKRAEELVAKEAEGEPAPVIAANRFKQSFGWILTQTVDSITAEDIIDIRTALEVYKIQDEDTKALLKNEYTLLSALLTRSQALADAEKGNGTINTSPDTNDTQPTEPTGEEDNATTPSTVVINGKVVEQDVSLSFPTRQVGLVTLLLPVAVGAALIIFATLQVYYHCYFKKKGFRVGHVSLNKEVYSK